MQHLIHKNVEVITSETTYRGILIEVGISEIQLQGETGWIVVPLEKVLEVREAEEQGII